MVLGRVVSEKRGSRDVGDGGRKNMGFGGMEIAAAGVDAERPGRITGGFPGGERERIVEETRN